MKSKGTRNGKRLVFVVDDHPIVRHGIAQLINRETDLEVCGEAEDEAQAVATIGRIAPDIALVDLMLKNGSGISLIQKLKARYPKLPVIVLSMHSESLYCERVFRAGANGYLMKKDATEKLLVAIRRALAGQCYLSEQMQSRLLQAPRRRGESVLSSPLERLSNRELEVFRLLGEGNGSGEIAIQLNLSVSTVESHRMNIKKKLGLRDAGELLQHAIRWVETESPG